MRLKDVISPFYVWKRALEKPYTNTKPLTTRPGSDRYRGFHDNISDICIGCGTCEAVCQNAAIDMVPYEGVETTMGDSGLRPMIDYGRCCWCALCVDVCTTNSLKMTNEYVWLSTTADDMCFVPGLDQKSWNGAEKGYRKAEGFELLDYKRQEMGHIPFDEGVKSFIEMCHGYSKEQAIKEAERCVSCGICIAQCPAHMDIPNYIGAIRDGDFEKGLQILYKTNPMSSTCGRICTHRCEDVCSVGAQGDPVAIRWLKRYIIDQVPIENFSKILETNFPSNGKKVNIVGAGPGGLSAAYYLAMMGYDITIYEAKEAAGGMIRYGVPSYRMPYDEIDKEVKYLEDIGIKFIYNTRVGKDVTLKKLYDESDALFFSTGLFIPYTLGIEGEDHPRVLNAIDILDDVTAGKDPGVGKRVAVVGGGDVAMDACRVSRRFGAEVHLYYRRTIKEMPASEEEIIESQGENVNYHLQAIPVKIENSDDPNKIKMVWGEAKMVAPEGGGRMRPVLQEDKMHTDEFDCVIAAIGQEPDLSFIEGDFKEKLQTKWGKVLSDEYKQTAIPKLFVGGDIANDTKDAVSAIADGHLAAKGIDQLLNGGYGEGYNKEKDKK